MIGHVHVEMQKMTECTAYNLALLGIAGIGRGQCERLRHKVESDIRTCSLEISSLHPCLFSIVGKNGELECKLKGVTLSSHPGDDKMCVGLPGLSVGHHIHDSSQVRHALCPESQSTYTAQIEAFRS